MKFIWVSVKMSSNSAWLVRGHIQQGGAATSEVCQGAWGLEVAADYLWWGGHGRGNTRGAGVEVADGRVTSREAIIIDCHRSSWTQKLVEAPAEICECWTFEAWASSTFPQAVENKNRHHDTNLFIIDNFLDGKVISRTDPVEFLIGTIILRLQITKLVQTFPVLQGNWDDLQEH